MHISQLRDGYAKNPNDVIKPRQRVFVTVIGVDLERKRISLSMKQQPLKSGH